MSEITVCKCSKASAQKKTARFADQDFPLKMTSVENYRVYCEDIHAQQ